MNYDTLGLIFMIMSMIAVVFAFTGLATLGIFPILSATLSVCAIIISIPIIIYVVYSITE